MRRYFCLTLFGVVIIYSSHAWASIEKFKDAIWRDCSEATREASNFDVEQRQTAVTFLVGIVSLDLVKVEESPLVNPGLISAPDGVLNDVSLALSLDPERPNRAKRCAAEILPILVPESSQALPSLVKQSAEVRLNFEVRGAFARTAYNLAQLLSIDRGSSSQPQLPGKEFEELFAIVVGQQNTLGEQVLSLFPLQFATKLSDHIAISNCEQDCKQEDKLIGLLSRLDFQIAGVKEALIRLLPRVGARTRVALLKAIQFNKPLYEPLLGLLIARLFEAEGAERDQIIQTLSTIFDSELRSASLAIDPHERLRLVSAFPAASFSEREVIEKGLMVIAPLFPEFGKAILPLVKMTDEDLRMRAARLLARITTPGREEKRALAQLQSDESMQVRQVALDATLSSTDTERLLKYALELRNLIANSYSKKKISEPQSLDAYLDLLRTVSQISTTNLPSIWSSLALETIEMGIRLDLDEQLLSPAIAILEQQASSAQVVAQLRNFARSKVASKRNTAIFIFQRGVVKDPSIFETLLLMLADSDSGVAHNAQLALLVLRNDLAGLLKARRSFATSPRYEELLLEAGLRPEREAEIQRRVGEVDCSEIAQFSGVCLQRTEVGAFCSSVVAQVPRCVEQGILNTLPQGLIERAISLQPKVRDLFNTALLDPQTPRSAQFEIGLSLLRAKVSQPQMLIQLCNLSNIASEDALAELVSYVSLDASLAKECVGILKKYFEGNDISSEQRALLFRQILVLDAQSVDVPLLLRHALEKKDLTFLKVVAKGQLVSDLLTLLGSVLLDSSDDEARIVALKLAEELGEKSVSQLSAIQSQLDSNNNEVRYHAARALISCNADPVLSAQALRAILNSPSFRDLLVDPLPVNLTQVVEGLLSTPKVAISTQERHDLLRLLRVIRGPEAVIPEIIEQDNLPHSPLPSPTTLASNPS